MGKDSFLIRKVGKNFFYITEIEQECFGYCFLEKLFFIIVQIYFNKPSFLYFPQKGHWRVHTCMNTKILVLTRKNTCNHSPSCDTLCVKMILKTMPILLSFNGLTITLLHWNCAKNWPLYWITLPYLKFGHISKSTWEFRSVW